jgi:hypothetical protein
MSDHVPGETDRIVDKDDIETLKSSTEPHVDNLCIMRDKLE